MPLSPARRLLQWFDRYGRDLPWRKTRNAYHILVSEVMLQQTQVSRVTLYYARWLTQFPNWDTLAKASNEEVIRLWSGLGYNRRALMLRDAARTIIKDGEPKSAEDWRSIKGIGPYTAAALAIFSLHKKILPIDTNIRRVGARLWLGIPFPSQQHDEPIRQAGDTFLSQGTRFYDIPQALFDLATSICTKKPACEICPLQKDCQASSQFLAGAVTIPKQSIKKTFEFRHRDKPFPDRIYRGRILKLLQQKRTLSINTLGTNIDPAFETHHDQPWLLRMLDRMEKDQLIKVRNNKIEIA